MKRSEGWPLQGLGTAALLAVTAVPLWGAGWLLAHASDFVGRFL